MKVANLNIKDRVKLSGGYDMEPRWLCGKEYHLGEVLFFIPGQNKELAAVVKLDNPISLEEISGNIVVLELRYNGAQWKEQGHVHIELCDFIPDSKPWKERSQGKWVESHAFYEVLLSKKTFFGRRKYSKR